MALGNLRILWGFFLCPEISGEGDVTTQGRTYVYAMNTTPLYKRSPKRLAITMSWVAFQRLNDRALMEGRSMSNLAAWLLERDLDADLRSGTQTID